MVNSVTVFLGGEGEARGDRAIRVARGPGDRKEDRACLYLDFFLFFVCVCFCLLGLHLRHLEVPRLGFESGT